MNNYRFEYLVFSLYTLLSFKYYYIQFKDYNYARSISKHRKTNIESTERRNDKLYIRHKVENNTKPTIEKHRKETEKYIENIDFSIDIFNSK